MDKSNLELFKQALSEGIGNRFDKLAREYTGELVCSKKHKIAMNTIVYGKTTGKVVLSAKMKKVIAILVAAAVLLTGCTITFREKIFSFITKITSSYVKYSVSDSDDDIKEITDIYRLSYLPEGFALKESQNLINMIYNTYCNPDGEVLIFHQKIANSTLGSFTNENAEVNKYIINDFEIYEVISDISYIYIWNDSKYILTIDSPHLLPIHELEQIINGITIK